MQTPEPFEVTYTSYFADHGDTELTVRGTRTKNLPSADGLSPPDLGELRIDSAVGVDNEGALVVIYGDLSFLLDEVAEALTNQGL